VRDDGEEKVKIVVLDGYVLNPGDFSWKPLEEFGECEVYERTPPHLIKERSKGVEILLTNKTELSGALIEALEDLRYIGVLATGYNVVDIEAAAKKKIPVTNVPGYAADSVAQHTFALLLELALHTGLHSSAVHSGVWAKSRDFSWWNSPLLELAGLQLGIVGYGSIGKKVAHIARAFGMSVSVYTRHPNPDDKNVDFVDIECLFRESDIISLHSPLTKENSGFVNHSLLSLMKPSAFLLNTARGGLIQEEDLAKALTSGMIAGAGLDVLSVEPPHPDNPLLSVKNCIITPHIAWATVAARKRLLEGVVENVKSFLEGNLKNVVNANIMNESI
jgi:glycerate dehydrogenase